METWILYLCIRIHSFNSIHEFPDFPHYCKCLESIIKSFKKVNVFRTIIYLSSINMQLIIFSLKTCLVILSYTNRLSLRLASISFKSWTLQRNPTFIKFWHGLNFFSYCELSCTDNNFCINTYYKILDLFQCLGTLPLDLVKWSGCGIYENPVKGST